MSLIPRNQFFDLDTVFNDFFPGLRRPALRGHADDPIAGMRVDVHEGDEGWEIHAELPGVKKKDIEIALQDNVLTVTASKQTESEDKKKGKVIWRERSSGSISRSFSVSPGTTEKDISANFTDGVLTISGPRKQPPKAESDRQRIEVK